LRLISEAELDLADRAVLLVDDIVDTGRTLRYARDLLRGKKVATVLTCALVDKRSAARYLSILISSVSLCLTFSLSAMASITHINIGNYPSLG
jgi:hypoxanthine-guanine phosphoribosyltransferase